MADQAPPIQQGDTGAGPGGPEPLPYGQATELNTDLAAAKQASPTIPTETVPTEAPSSGTAAAPPTEPVSVGTSPQPFVKGSTGLDPDQEAFLLGPTERPGEPVHAGLLMNGNIAPTPDVYENLAALRAAAADPTAPPGLVLMLNLVAEQLP